MCGLDLVGNEENDLKTTNMPWSFRFHKDLKAAITKAVKESGMTRPEWVAMACCEKAGIEYIPNPAGRRWPEKSEKPPTKKKNKPV